MHNGDFYTSKELFEGDNKETPSDTVERGWLVRHVEAVFTGLVLVYLLALSACAVYIFWIWT